VHNGRTHIEVFGNGRYGRSPARRIFSDTDVHGHGQVTNGRMVRHKHMEYQATTKYVRSSTPQGETCRGQYPLRMTPGAALLSLSIHRKRLPSHDQNHLVAVANAKQKGIDEAILRFKTIEIMGGPVMKRWNARFPGQAACV